mgnify:CR=1 FL=1
MCNNKDFVHLHAHTHFSIQDALPTPKNYANKAREMGFRATAITDHGKMGGVVEFAESCKIPGNTDPIKPIIGIEVYTHLQQTLESQKMYPLLPCNMISSFARVMEYVEYFDIPSEERKKLVVDLMRILAYSNNEYAYLNHP